MPANPVHHTAVVDEPWDGPGNEAKLSLPVTKARGNGMYAWHVAGGADPDNDGYPDAKSDSKFPHHMVGADGNPGAANLNGCRAVLQRLSQADIPSGDDAGVQAHAQAHLDDEPEAGATDFGHLNLEVLAPRSYEHVTKALYERPWAIQRQMLTFMANLISFRAAGGAFTASEIAERLEAAKAQNGPRDQTSGNQVGAVAIIPMYGLLSQRAGLMSDMSGGTSLDELRGSLQSALRDPSVRAIVFDIDSPGGSTDGLTEFAADLRAARSGPKPIVAQVNTLAASAAYWLASQCSEIVCTPSGEVGSVGVFAVHEDLSQAEAMAGVKTTVISAGKYKVEGNEFEPLTDDARQAIQEQVDTFYQMFLGDVAKGRRTNVQAVADGYGEGRTMLAKKALDAGVVDRIDSLAGTVARLQPAARAPRAAATVVPIEQAAAAAADVHRADPAWNARMSARVSKRRIR